MNIPILIHKGIGKGSSQNLGIEEIGNTEVSCLCARDYKGISRMRANAVIVGGNKLTTQAEQGVVVFDDRNGKVKDEETIGGLVTDNSSPKKNNRIGIADETTKGKLRIRKLTPKECWRLQGWGFIREDGTWDDTAFEKAKASGVSDSQLYKQAGNGCSANVVMAIGLKLKELEESGI